VSEQSLTDQSILELKSQDGPDECESCWDWEQVSIRCHLLFPLVLIVTQVHLLPPAAPLGVMIQTLQRSGKLYYAQFTTRGWFGNVIDVYMCSFRGYETT
jgi:hypothetical protein